MRTRFFVVSTFMSVLLAGLPGLVAAEARYVTSVREMGSLDVVERSRIELSTNGGAAYLSVVTPVRPHPAAHEVRGGRAGEPVDARVGVELAVVPGVIETVPRAAMCCWLCSSLPHEPRTAAPVT